MARYSGEENRFVWFIDEVGIWSVNPYQRCSFRCVYCIAASQGEATPWYPVNQVVSESNKALDHIPSTTELFIGAMADAYPPVEEQLGITRVILKEISRQERSFCINTKSTLVCRDIDILQVHTGHCDVYISLCTLDEDAVRVLEPGSPSVAERLDAISILNDAGIDVNVDASPWIPSVSDAGGLIAALPEGVGIQFGPLDIRHFGEPARFLGRTFTQQEVNEAYMAERQRISDQPGIHWKGAPQMLGQ